MTPDQLRLWRTGLGLTQAQAAARLGVKPVTLQRWEQGSNPIPEIAGKLVAALRREERAKPLPPVLAATPLVNGFRITHTAWPSVEKWLAARKDMKFQTVLPGSVVIEFTRAADAATFRFHWGDVNEHDLD